MSQQLGKVCAFDDGGRSLVAIVTTTIVMP
ncbi:hypothetical protein C7374_10686 [Falsochrobactrum ovis]|uniref:Uncharacterized protein n=1 Tax=Falsochrobactrum ovis TaxID=1293442 RepID=A0A364JVB5_9HYPH|nr:hypothetical protein C7374_10686 [Falsochrobactrum ovis]